ncbi:calcium/sodium antiporter [Rhodohalobacter sp. 8-1]|uniref:calcium/sodium antiporter n=1 Tax=Rhodohalobacter sp. 8-1 TaxID=3131972 RepID=UPI0030EDB298
MLIPTLWFIIGLIALIWGAEILVRSSSKLAASLGVSKLVIGLTVVAFGTSAPELAVGIEAGIMNQPDILMGNVIGSNLTNTLLILGLASIIIPLQVHKNLIRFDLPVMISATLILILLSLNNIITFWESALLVACLLVYLYALVRFSGKSRLAEDELLEAGSPWKNGLLSVAGLVLLIAGARWMVESATIFAVIAGVSELVIGLTIVAIGTSLPEIVTSILAAVRGEKDLAVGSIVGSNILNILSVIGISGLFISGIPVQDTLLEVEYLVLLAVSVLCFPLFFTGLQINRIEGGILFSSYILYLFYLYLNSITSSYLASFVQWVLYGFVPLVVLYLIISLTIEFKTKKAATES